MSPRHVLIVTRELGDPLGAVLGHREYACATETGARLALDRFTAQSPALTIVDLASLGHEGLDLIADLPLTDVNAAIVEVGAAPRCSSLRCTASA